MRILILTEGGIKIGFGHIARCLPIYNAFIELEFVVDFIIDGDSSINKFLDDRIKLINWNEDKSILSVLQTNYEIVILDSLRIKTETYKILINSGSSIVVIDDLQLREYNNDEIVVDWLVNAEKDPFYKNKNVILGTKYVPLRDSFKNIDKKVINKKVKEIVITLGGTDFRNMAPKIIEFLKNQFPEFIVHLFVAEGFVNITEIEEKRYSNLKIHYKPNDAEMIKICLDADIAIATGGHTINELAAIGIPTIHFLVVDNQRKAEGWKHTGFTEFIGWWDDLVVLDKLDSAIIKLMDSKIRYAMHKAGKKMVDGNGAVNLVKELVKRFR